MKIKTKKSNNNKNALAAIWASLLSLLFNLGSFVLQMAAALLSIILPIIILIILGGIALFLKVLKKPFNKPPSHNQNNTQEIRISQKEYQHNLSKKMQEVYNNNFAIDAKVILQQEALKQMALQKQTAITNTNPIIESQQQYQPAKNYDNDNKILGLTNDQLMIAQKGLEIVAMVIGIGMLAAACPGTLPFLALA